MCLACQSFWLFVGDTVPRTLKKFHNFVEFSLKDHNFITSPAKRVKKICHGNYFYNFINF
ncbi:MAG: hypothetical protein CO093_06385 [Alphaproteobacteria bacterium CG_4_9_14_3_um_filter_47_13]|nr:MAG: hypothetical protein CO093_06385 [Alphaproteobacteria bacterium CG_4_9_14_3_um_filter_47_13]